MTVLVTGASGYVGRAIALRLVAAGARVRGLVRTGARPLPAGVEAVPGDLRDPPSLVRAVAGADAVVHAAAHLGGGPRSTHARVTVAGTAAVLAAARAAGVRRVVHLSTVAVHGWQPPGTLVGPEDAPEPQPERRDDYAWAKIHAERWVWLHRQHGLDAAVLRPGIVYGRGHEVLGRVVRPLPGGVLLVAGGPHMVLPLVHVADVAEAAARALDAPCVPASALPVVGPEQPTQRAWLERRAKHRGERRRVIYLGLGAARLLARRGARGAHAASRAYALAWTAQAVRYDVRPTAAALGWAPRITPAEGLSRDPSPTGRDHDAARVSAGR